MNLKYNTLHWDGMTCSTDLSLAALYTLGSTPFLSFLSAQLVALSTEQIVFLQNCIAHISLSDQTSFVATY